MNMLEWIKQNKGVLLLLAGAIIVIGGILLWKKYSRKVEFDFKFGNLSTLIGQLETKNNQRGAQEKGIEINISAPFTALVKNKENKPLEMNDAKIDLSYKGEKIMNTSGDGISETIPAKQEKSIPSKINVLVNGTTISFVKALIKGENPKLDYKIKTMIMGEPYTFDGTKIIQE